MEILQIDKYDLLCWPRYTKYVDNLENKGLVRIYIIRVSHLQFVGDTLFLTLQEGANLTSQWRQQGCSVKSCD